MILAKYELEGKLSEENRLIERGVLRDENPLDQSPEFDDLLLACRRGDLRKCQQLITLGVNINGKDAFDYTPLIIASLCGHYELVRLLLESGALAERNTFQGERCIYNALNDRIRNLLLEYDFSKSSDPLVYWTGHISSLLRRDTPPTADLTLSVSGNEWIKAHKFILAAHTRGFEQGIAPGLSSWNLGLSSVPQRALEIALRHVYLDDLPRELVPPGSSADDEAQMVAGLDRVSRQLGIRELWEAVLAAREDRRLARQRFQDHEAQALRGMKDFFQRNVLDRKMEIATQYVDRVRWDGDNAAFADVLLRIDCSPDSLLDHDAASPVVLNSHGIPSTSDDVDDGPTSKKPTSTLYPAHKAMLIRSQYFAKMFSGDFVEARSTPHLRIITVDCSVPVLELILSYLYTESADIPLEHALDVVYAADMLFLDTLKNKAAMAISTLGSSPALHNDDTELVNIYDVIYAAWDLALPRLEEFAARYIAARLESYIDDAVFHDLVRASAARIRVRQDTDSIELIDDIRYFLSERFRLRFEDVGLRGAMLGAAAEKPSTNMASQAESTQPDATKSPIPVTTSDTATIAPRDASSAQEPPECDEFISDSLNYHDLLERIDAMLEQLGLDA